MNNYSAIIPETCHENLKKHLIRFDEQEDLCFATYVPSNGKNRLTGIITSLILPKRGERKVHGNVGFLPSYFERVIKIAIERKEGIAFLHSHPWPGWQGMSDDDVIAENRMAPTVMAATGLPLLGLTLGTDEAWSARFWLKDKVKKRTYIRWWCETVRVLGKGLRVTFNENILMPNFNSKKQLRTISAWGQNTQEDLSRLKVGIVGLGSVGSIVAEILARTGISNFTLIDFDSVEDKNLDRLTNVFAVDVGKSKVEAISRGIKRSATSPKITIIENEFSICEKEGFMEALDCDVLFSCVDMPWPREVLNFISYAHMIPIIDGGILVRTNKKNTKILGADWKTQTVGYGRPCLECLGQYKAENAALERSGVLNDPTYIKGLKDVAFINAHENVYVFSSHLASLEVLQLLSLFISPSGISSVGQQMHHFVTGEMESDSTKKCYPNCYFQTILGKGDLAGVIVYGEHKAAADMRQRRKNEC